MQNWKIKEQVSENLEQQLLVSRGIKTDEEKRKFFSPDYEKDLHDPFKILDMDKAVSRIKTAVEKKEKVLLYCDYDADGVCSAAIFNDFFMKIGFSNFEVYIPDRNKDGYGFNENSIKEILEKQIKLIITLDCGITEYKEIERLKKNNIEVVIIDHHLQVDKVPLAVAVVDPKQKKDKYPFKMLCGAGVAFKTVQALIDTKEFGITSGWEKWLLDLVAIATVADMMPLVDENRVLVHYGLKVFKKTQRPGLAVFFDKLNIDKTNINEDDIGFTIAPRINIASRMDHANTSYAILTTKSKDEAEWILERLNGLNVDRREVVGKILEKVEADIAEKKEKPKIIVVGDLSWNVGVLGLTAARLKDKFQCPVFLWGKGDAETVKGSVRSNGVNTVELMEQLPKDILIEFGGHAFSAGFSLKEEKIEEFERELVKIFLKTERKETEEEILVDKECKLEEVDWWFLETIEKFRPFGIDNPRPIFLFKDIEIFGLKTFGAGGVHLQLDFKGKNGIISAIGFFMGSLSLPNGGPGLKKGDKIDLAASVERNTYNGYEKLRLRIIDLKLN